MERIVEQAKDTAAKIRKALKVAFPATKFSVRTSLFSMGSSVDISWKDGASVEAVEAITDRFVSGSFNGMEDIYETSGYEFEGKIYIGAKYICTSRSLSPEYKAQIQEKAAEIFGDFEIGGWGYPQKMALAEAIIVDPAGEDAAMAEYWNFGSVEEYRAAKAQKDAKAEVEADEVLTAEIIIVEAEELAAAPAVTAEDIVEMPAAKTLDHPEALAEYIVKTFYKPDPADIKAIASDYRQQKLAEAEEDQLVNEGLRSGFVVDLMLYKRKKGIA